MKKLSKLLLALSFVLSVTTSAFAVTVVSWGGAYTESQKLGYGDPTAAKLGIPVNWVDYTGGLSEIKAQKEAGAITWDIIDVYAKDTIIGCDEGIFHEFDFDKDFLPAPDGTPASQDFFTVCLLNVQLETFCTLGTMLIMMIKSEAKNQKLLKTFLILKSFQVKEQSIKAQCLT